MSPRSLEFSLAVRCSPTRGSTMNTLEKVLLKEQFRHDMFPILLLLMQERPTWKARATALNAANLTTFCSKPWTKQNVHKMFHTYWDNDLGRYSWVEQKQWLDQLTRLIERKGISDESTTSSRHCSAYV